MKKITTLAHCASLIMLTLVFMLTSANAQAEQPLTLVNKEPSTFKLTNAEKRWISNHPNITIAFDGNYPPYSYERADGEFVGIAVDIAQLLAKRTGLKLNLHPSGNWRELYESAQSGKVDVIATLVKKSGREQWFEFTRPYLSLSQYVITRDETLREFDTLEKLKGKKLALIRGYSTSEYILNDIPDIQPYYVTSLLEALEAVSIGLADATIADLGTANHLITHEGLTNLKFSTLYTKRLSKQSFGVRKDWPQLATILDKALGSLTYQELTDIYLYWHVPEVVKPAAGFISVQAELTESEKAWLKAHPVIRLASDFAWPPFESIDSRGAYSGIAADYMALIEERLGVDFVTSPQAPWSDIVEMVKNKELDVLSCAMETTDRKSFAQFTQPYISQPTVIISKADNGFIDGLRGLYGKTVAIEQSYASYEILKKNHPEIQLKPVKSTRQALLSVSKGEAFAYAGNLASASYVLRDQGLSDLRVSGQIPYQYNLSIGVRDDWAEFVPILQKALDSISLEEKNGILKKWVSVEFKKQFDFERLVQAAALILAVILAILYWNYQLKKKIKQRTFELDYQANYDSLTGLPNRFQSIQTFNKLSSREHQNSDSIVLLILDIDDFKKINDVLGHDIGDQLIIEITKRLKQEISHATFMGRLGGDEFIIYLDDLDKLSDIEQEITRIIELFKIPFDLNNRNMRITVSIGASRYPDNGENISDLLGAADTALFHAKSLGRNTYSLFSNSMKQAADRRLLLDEQLQTALANQEFSVYFQPKVDIQTRQVFGYEALIRWTNPELGFIPPDEFISVAEKNGMIIEIGKFVIDQSMQQLKAWKTQSNSNLTVSINLSPVQFRDEHLLSFISEQLKKHELQAGDVGFEITEGVLIEAYVDIDDLLTQLRDLGIRIIMDDFGKGYSSLSYLRSYAFDLLKIDREFIEHITSDPSDEKLVKAAIAMGKSLGLKIVAEGVETEEQFELLKQLHCDYAQGYLFGKPAPASEIVIT